MVPENNQHIISLLMKKGLPFAVFRLPGDDKVHSIIQAGGKLESISIEELDEAEGFAVAKFKGFQTGNFILIKPDWNFDTISLKEKISEFPDTENVFKENQIISEKEYLETAYNLIQEMKAGKIKKVVFSRVIPVELDDNFELGNFFYSLEQTYHQAFVYLINLPGKGTWAGATPEVLLGVNEKVAETVSLAGTKQLENESWSEKEFEEQRIVSDYIFQTLKNLGIKNINQKGPETVVAGNVAHLKTIFQFQASEIKMKTGKLIQELNPTPAVCGFPKETAFNLILKTEKHERRFYTGFLGPINFQGKTDLFVNLRCAEIGKNKMNLYVGGGLTSASLPEKEWEETTRKSGTLLSIAKKL